MSLLDDIKKWAPVSTSGEIRAWITPFATTGSVYAIQGPAAQLLEVRAPDRVLTFTVAPGFMVSSPIRVIGDTASIDSLERHLFAVVEGLESVAEVAR